MQPHRAVDEAATPQPLASTPVTAPVVPRRSARRATTRRAPPHLAKRLNADRGKLAAARSQIANAGETAKDLTAR